MPRDVYQLGLDASGMVTGSRTAGRSLDDIRAKAGASDRALTGTERSLQLVRRALTALGGAAVLRGILRVTRTFENLRAQLKTVVGSISDAARSFKELAAFSARTPFQLQDVIQAFTLLKTVGVEPTIGLLTSIGNTAAAFGRSISDFASAVVNAVTGENEALKAFGIVASSQGEKVRFTFQGVTTEVGRNAEEIVAFLRKVGETDFASGMADRVATVDGAFSTLLDNIQLLINDIAGGGNSSLAGAIRVATDAVGNLRKNLDLLRQVLLAIAAVSIVRLFSGMAASSGALAESIKLIRAGMGALIVLNARLAAKEALSLMATRAASLITRLNLISAIAAGIVVVVDRWIQRMNRLHEATLNNVSSMSALAEQGRTAAGAVRRALEDGSGKIGESTLKQLEATVQALIVARDKAVESLKDAGSLSGTEFKEAQQHAAALAALVDQWGVLLARAKRELVVVPEEIREGENEAGRLRQRLEEIRREIFEIGLALQGRSGTVFNLSNLAPFGSEVPEESELFVSRLSEAEQILESSRQKTEAIAAFIEENNRLTEAGQATQEELNAQYASAETILKTWGVDMGFFLNLLKGVKIISEELELTWRQIGNEIAKIAVAGGLEALFSLSRGGSAVGALGSAGSAIGGLFGKKAGEALGVAAGSVLGTAMPILGSMLGQVAGEQIGKVLDNLFGSGSSTIGSISIGSGGVSTSGKPRLRNQLNAAGAELNRTLAELEQMLGTTAITLANVTIDIRDNGNIWVQLAGQVNRKFKDLNEAISFALTEAIKGAQIVGAPQEFITALANSQATNLEELFRDLEVVQRALAVTTGETALEIRQAVVSFEQFRAELQRLGLDTSIASQELAQNLQAMRNGILGINETAEERIRRQAAEFNRERQLLEAEKTAELADLQLKLALLKANQQVTQANLQAGQAYVQGLAGVAVATINVAGVMASAVAAVEAAIKEIEGLLSALPELISEEEIQKAIRRSSRGFGGFNKALRTTNNELETAIENLQEYRRSLLGGSSLSALPPQAQFEHALEEFNRISVKAQAGNVQALQQLPQVANALLQLTQQVNPAAFGSIFNQVMAVLNKILGLGSESIQGFARGGVVTQEQVIRVAEFGIPEAVIPLPNGAVPVRMMMPPERRRDSREDARFRRAVVERLARIDRLKEEEIRIRRADRGIQADTQRRLARTPPMVARRRLVRQEALR